MYFMRKSMEKKLLLISDLLLGKGFEFPVSFNKITVKEVCTGALLSRNAFYTHYPDINGLIAEIENQLLDQVQAILDEFVDGLFPHNMLVSLQRMLEMLSENKEITLMLIDNSNSTTFLPRLKEILGDFFFG